MKKIIVAFILAPTLYAAQLCAITPTYLGSYYDWAAFTFKEASHTHCYMMSLPTKTEGISKTHKSSALYITHRPSIESYGEVSFMIGHNLKHNEKVTLQIDKKNFTLMVKGSKAWAKNRHEDKALAEAILKGSKLTLNATLRSGKKIKQIYSLRGSTAAHQLIDKKCPFAHDAAPSV